MVRLSKAGPWIVGLLAAVGKNSVRASGNIVPGAFIVEFEDGVDIDGQLASLQDVAQPRMTLNYTLFRGASIRFHDVDTAPHQARLMGEKPAIKRILPLTTYSVPKYDVHWTAGEHGHAEGPASGGAVKARQETEDTFSPHIMTQVDMLRNKGVVGNDIKVAVIDTGVDYMHPALGGCFGPGCLVSFGYDLVGDDYDGTNIGVPDPDPMEECRGHGTHVAGIIAAQVNNPYGIIGAATGVTMGHYRVFGCTGESGVDVLIAAFHMAYEAGADVITASIGASSGWSEDAWAVAVSGIVEAGVVCTISAGNDGDLGLFDAATAASGRGVASIASVDNILTPTLLVNATFTITSSQQGGDSPIYSFGYLDGYPAAWADLTLPLFAVSMNKTIDGDACDPLPPAGMPADLSQYVVLVRRGGCYFSLKLTNVAQAGGRYVIIYDNLPSGALPSASADEGSGIEAVATVAADVGETWVDALANGQTVTLTMPDPSTADRFLVSPVNNYTGGYMSEYSSWGPTFEVEQKPQFASPGGQILSTWPRALGSYAQISGTSMACPLVAGIYALLMEVRGTKDPKTLGNLLSATAKPLAFNDGLDSYPIIAPTAQQGAGIVQAFDAAYATTELDVSSLSFNDTDNINPEQSFTISNNGAEAMTYTLRDAAAATAYTLGNDGSVYPVYFPNELVENAASVSFSVDNPVTIAAGERKVVTVTLTPPADVDAARLPVYSGYVVLEGSDSTVMSLPYLGVAGSLRRAAVLGMEATYLTNSLSGGTNATGAIAAGRTFVLPPPGMSNESQFAPYVTDYPVMQVSLAMGSALVRMNVVPVSVPEGTNISDSLGMATVGEIYQAPFEYVPRNLADAPWNRTWDGRLATGEYAPPGTYKLAVRALNILGNRMDASGYDQYESPEFVIQYMSNCSTSAVRGRRVKRDF